MCGASDATRPSNAAIAEAIRALASDGGSSTGGGASPEYSSRRTGNAPSSTPASGPRSSARPARATCTARVATAAVPCPDRWQRARRQATPLRRARHTTSSASRVLPSPLPPTITWLLPAPSRAADAAVSRMSSSSSRPTSPGRYRNGRGGGPAARSEPASMRSSTRTTSEAWPGRSRGSFRSRDPISAIRSSGTPDTSSAIRGGARCTWSDSCARTGPVNGGLPVSHSNSMQPTAYRSARASPAMPSTSSGAMYGAVPPGAQSSGRSRRSPRPRDSPRSTRTGRPSGRTIAAHLRSAGRRPRCSCARPRAACAPPRAPSRTTARRRARPGPAPARCPGGPAPPARAPPPAGRPRGPKSELPPS